MYKAIVSTIWKPDHSKSRRFCPDFKWLGFRISDPIQNPDHLQLQPLFDHLKFTLVPISDPHCNQGLILPTKKSEKFPEFGSDFLFLENSILSKILGSYFQKSAQLAAPKNQIWFFSDFSKKIWGFKIFRFIRKKIWIWEYLLVGSSPGVERNSRSHETCYKPDLFTIFQLTPLIWIHGDLLSLRARLVEPADGDGGMPGSCRQNGN